MRFFSLRIMRRLIAIALTFLVFLQFVFIPRSFPRHLHVPENIKPHTSPGTIAAVINTPKMGTGGLFLTFRKTWGCKDIPSEKELFTVSCKNDRLAFRTHDVDAGLLQIQQHRKEFPEGQCLIVTAMRSPVGWFGSLFLQRAKKHWGSREQMIMDYKKFLSQRFLLNTLEGIFPHLLREFSGGSLTEQAQIMDENGGYSFLGPAPPESDFAGCNLLFLRMEESDRWPKIFQMIEPKVRFERGESRVDQNPDYVDQISAIASYELTSEERMAIYTKGGPLVADWFNAYGYSLQSDEKMRSLIGPGMTVAVINTAKMGTGGLTLTFSKSWKCKGGPSIPKLGTFDCEDDRMLFRTHYFDDGTNQIQRRQELNPNGKCLLIASIRSPTTWFGSFFLQKAKKTWKAKEEMLEDYKRFLLSNQSMEMLHAVLPHLLRDFNAGSLVEQAKIIDQNGFSLLSAAAESSVAGCELLLLRMEESDKWPEIFNRIDPMIKFERGVSRIDQHPDKTAEIKTIADYELTSEERMSIYNRGGPLVADWFEAYNYDLNAEDKPETINKPGTVVAIMNTPRMATGSLFATYRNSWSCTSAPPVAKVRSFNCDDDRLVFRTHWFDAGLSQIQQHRERHPEGQCLVVTVIRNPATWMASIFLQMQKSWKSDEDMLIDYRNFIASDHFMDVLQGVLPDLLREFNAGSLTAQAKEMDQNGGYSLLSAPPESSLAGCEVLLLRLEQSHRWEEIFEMIDPNIKVEVTPSRLDQHPNIAHKINEIANYDLTFEERGAIYAKGGPFVADWFDSYRYMDRLVEQG